MSVLSEHPKISSVPLPADHFKLNNGIVVSVDPTWNGQVLLLLTTPGNRHEAFAWDLRTNKFQGENFPQDCFDGFIEYKRRNDIP